MQVILLSFLTLQENFRIPAVRQYYKGMNLKKLVQCQFWKHQRDLKPTKLLGYINLAGSFLKDGSNILCTPIAKICNLSIKLASFQDKWKVAKIKPLYKKGLKTDPRNFRPISLLPPISKIIEQIIHDETMNFLSDNNLIYKYQ